MKYIYCTKIKHDEIVNHLKHASNDSLIYVLHQYFVSIGIELSVSKLETTKIGIQYFNKKYMWSKLFDSKIPDTQAIYGATRMFTGLVVKFNLNREK